MDNQDIRTWGKYVPHTEYTYEIDLDDSDEAIEEYIEQRRKEYHKAWFKYVAQYE